jgi:hypothetical protein
MDYNARFYSPTLGRFTQPDSIIPNPARSQNWNRYSYVLNNPINANDPTGHKCVGEVDECKNDDKTSINGSSSSHNTSNGGTTNESSSSKKTYNNEKLKKELENFKGIPVVTEADVKTVSMGDFSTELTPGEYNLILLPNGKENRPLLAVLGLIYFDAMDTTESTFPSGEHHNNQADAFRHAYWSARITSVMGADYAKDFTTAHETDPKSERNEQFMDLHNNEVGITIGSQYSSRYPLAIKLQVLNALRNGDLYVWDGNDIYYSNDCPICK